MYIYPKRTSLILKTCVIPILSLIQFVIEHHNWFVWLQWKNKCSIGSCSVAHNLQISELSLHITFKYFLTPIILYKILYCSHVNEASQLNLKQILNIFCHVLSSISIFSSWFHLFFILGSYEELFKILYISPAPF